MNKTDLPVPQVDEAGISLLAYQKWQQAGCPEGQDMRFWFEAESQLRASAKASQSPPQTISATASRPTPSTPAAAKPAMTAKPVLRVENKSVRL
jgi:hypothetical protein